MDATKEDGSLGRLVNHGTKKKVNSKIKIIEIEGQPKLCLYSTRQIFENEEILYNYGGFLDFQVLDEDESIDGKKLLSLKNKRLMLTDRKNWDENRNHGSHLMES